MVRARSRVDRFLAALPAFASRFGREITEVSHVLEPAHAPSTRLASTPQLNITLGTQGSASCAEIGDVLCRLDGACPLPMTTGPSYQNEGDTNLEEGDLENIKELYNRVSAHVILSSIFEDKIARQWQWQ